MNYREIEKDQRISGPLLSDLQNCNVCGERAYKGMVCDARAKHPTINNSGCNWPRCFPETCPRSYFLGIR